MMIDSGNKRIAKNTLFLYMRMMLIMIVTLYASRVTLRVLGVDDYGIYQTVGGVVFFLAFLSNALGSGTSRFLTYEMGKEKPKMGALFSTVNLAHIVLAVFIVIVGEVVGLWVINNKLVIPEDRMDAAILAFHFSMVGTFFQITQIPYNAVIIAHERMIVFAWISIYEAVVKLGLVFVLHIFDYDKLVVYAALMAVATISVMEIYRIYCRIVFPETRSIIIFDRSMFKEVASFASWHLLSSSAASLANQGITIVTNMFFSPAVVAVRSLALKINETLTSFMGNFRTAVNPQIVKKYAANDREGSKRLALLSTSYTFYLMLMIVIPLFVLVEPALRIWLEEIPDGLVPFVQLALVQVLFQSFDTSLYVPIYANGRIKENAIISPLFDSLQLPLIYILFKMGYPPIALAWVCVFAYAILGMIIKPVIVHYIVGYSFLEIIRIEIKCVLIGLISFAFPYVVSRWLDVNIISGFSVVLMISLISTVAFVWFLGLDRATREHLLKWLTDKFMI